MSYMTLNKKHNQTLKSALYSLELSLCGLKLDVSLPQYHPSLSGFGKTE